MDQKNRQAGKRELFLTGAVLLTALLFFLVNRAFHKDQEYTVKNDQGGVNVFVIRDGKAWVTEASCPDKICMDQGQVSQEGEMIVCLPNRMTARVMGAP